MKALLPDRFWAPPLFREQPHLVRAVNFAAPPLIWGVLCGALSGLNRSVFLVGVALSVGGAFGAGRQHLGAASGALRGLLAGTLFGVAILAGHAVIGRGAVMLHPAPLQVAFTAFVGASFAGLGGATRLRDARRSRQRPRALAASLARGE